MIKLQKTDLDVLEFMIKDINTEYSIKQISDTLKRPYVKVHNSIKRLTAKGIILKKIMGKSHYCRVDYKNNLDVVCFIEGQRARKFITKKITDLKQSIKSPNYTLVVSGKDLILIGDVELKSEGIHVMSYEQFISMLEKKGDNLANNIVKDHIIVHGSEQFYECMRLAE